MKTEGEAEKAQWPSAFLRVLRYLLLKSSSLEAGRREKLEQEKAEIAQNSL